jgi:hypothetical protein
MFNNFSYRVAQKNSDYFYDTLRSGRLFDVDEYYEKYYNDIISKFNLDDNEMDYAMENVLELIQYSNLIPDLENIYRNMMQLGIDINSLKNFIYNFDEAFYSYARYKISFFPNLDNSNYNKLSESEKRNFILENKNDYYIGKIKGDQVSYSLENIIKKVNLLARYSNGLESALNLIQFFNKSEPYMLPLVYHKEKTDFYDKEFREKDHYLKYRKNIESSFPKEKKSSSVPSKYFTEFNLKNSSKKEKEIFTNLEKLGLHAIPAQQKGSISMLNEKGENFGFRIDFLLPCNVRDYDGENYTLRQDIIFIGEYFGYYGEDYENKKEQKIEWQNKFEKSLDQRCLHIDPNTDLCSVLREKNIDSKCYPDFGGYLFDVDDMNQRKTFYVKSQIQNFLYTYLVNELLWQINYNYYFNTMENLNKVKVKNQNYIDRYQELLNSVEKFTTKELAAECVKILDDYKKSFDREKKIGERSLRLSKTFNNRNNPSIL